MTEDEYNRYIKGLNLQDFDDIDPDEFYPNKNWTKEEWKEYIESISIYVPCPELEERERKRLEKERKREEQIKQIKTKKTPRKPRKPRIKKEIPDQGAESLI